ncbi:hypothetical protein BDB01DRAFT_892651 [Pilobolus umbonatus]|nr:hypothetical protein BDB01DRAFT_892651 [Pilobolus umbonatus]
MSSRILKYPSIAIKPSHKSQYTTKDDYESKIGQRVMIPSLDDLTGVLRYVGEPSFKQGIWAGIEVDKQGLGKNDGSVLGVRYFHCAPNQGIFIAYSKVILLPPLPPVPVKKPVPVSSISTGRRSNLPLNKNPSSSTSSIKKMVSRSSSSSNITHTSSTPTTNTTNPSIRTLTNNSTSMIKKGHSLRISTTPTTTPHLPSPPPVHSARHSISPPLSVKKSTPTPPPTGNPTPTPPIQDDTTHQLYEMLEKVEREKDTLTSQMKLKEAAWERLLTNKESLSLQLEDVEQRYSRLSRELDESRTECEQLQLSLAEKEASLAQNMRDDEKQSQDQKRIERLENLVRELQQQIEVNAQSKLQSDREHAGTIDQLRKEIHTSQSITASLEKECAELREAGLDAIHAYEASVLQLNQRHQEELAERDELINQLNQIITELKRKQSALFDDEEDIDDRLRDMPPSDWKDQRQRLEDQLEITMKELDHDRLCMETIMHEIDQLKAELNQSRQANVGLEQKYEHLQNELENELQDKRRLIEEADNAFEAHAKLADEHYQMKMTLSTIDKDKSWSEKDQLLETNRQLEQDYSKLMDDMLSLENQILEGKQDSYIKNTLDRLKKENDHYRLSLKSLELAKQTEVSRLSKDLNELESLVEHRVFRESEFEEQLSEEREKVKSLEKVIQQLQSSTQSPSHSTRCHLCDQYGHDELDCNKKSSLYCDNCDRYGSHSTDDCPNQDETF